jgi:hypothetical protein
MMRRTLLCFFIFGSAALACSSSGGNSSGASGCAEYNSTIDLTTPTVSFATDVQKIINQACTFPSCHGGNTGKLKLVQGDAKSNRTALVDVDAPESPGMKLVATGDPKNSWLMKKLDGDSCLFKGKCTDVGGTCADSMPQGNDLLAVDQRDTFRRWIAQGAKDN